MCHIVGITPEAPTISKAMDDREPDEKIEIVATDIAESIRQVCKPLHMTRQNNECLQRRKSKPPCFTDRGRNVCNQRSVVFGRVDNGFKKNNLRPRCPWRHCGRPRIDQSANNHRLGGVDIYTGTVVEPNHPLEGLSIKDSVLIFDGSKGSNGWSVFFHAAKEADFDKIYGELGCKFLLCGNSGAQMGGWFKNEINSIDDLKGIQMRIGGYGGAVMKSLGVELVNLPFSGKAIEKALQEGKIDAAEWMGPAPDMEAGLYKHAKYYYYPAWHEPSAAMDLFINKFKWEALSNDHKAVIKFAAAAISNRILCHNCYLNSASLSKLVNEHNVQLKEYPGNVLKKFRQISDKILHSIIIA